MRETSLLTGCVVFWAMAGVAGPAEDIAAANANFEATFNSGDASGMATYYTEDAIAHSPGWAVVTGPEPIARMYSAFFQAGFSNLRSEPGTLDVFDDVAVETFIDTATRTGGEGEKTDHSYKVLRVWKRDDDGTWRIFRTSFNPMPRN